MNVKDYRIRPFSMYALLFLSRIFGLLTFPNNGASKLSAGNGGLIALTYIPFSVLLSLPVLLLRTKTGAGGYRIGTTHPIAAKAISFGYACFFLLQASLSAVMLDSFSGIAMFQHSGHPFLFLLFFGLASVTAFTGKETAARAAPPVLLFFLFTVGVLAAATLPYFEPENLKTVSEVRPADLLQNGLFAALRTAEPAALLFFEIEQKKQRKAENGLIPTLCAIGVTVSLLFTLIAGVTGAFGETQRFQFYTLTTIAEVGTVERMDDLLCVLWVFCAMLKTVFYLSLTVDSLRPAGCTMESKVEKLALFAVAWGLYFLFMKAETIRRFFTDAAGNMAAVLIFTTIIPVVLFCMQTGRKKKGAAG